MSNLYPRLSIVIARHGETDYNKPPVRLQGQLDVPLNDIGKLQAKALGSRLSKEDFDLIYCSDLSRTKQTLEPLLEHKQGCRVIYEPRLRERDVGSLTDLYWTEAKTTIHEAGKTFEEYVSMSGESTEQFYTRVSGFWENMIATYLGQDRTDSRSSDGFRILVVTHGGVIANLLRYMIKELHYENVDVQAGRQLSRNTAVYRIQVDSCVDEVKGRIILGNCSAHLDDTQRLDTFAQHSRKLLNDFALHMNYF